MDTQSEVIQQEMRKRRAAAAGSLAGHFLSRTAHEDAGSKAPRLNGHYTDEAHRASAPASMSQPAEQPAEEGFAASMKSKFASEIDKLKGMGIAMALGAL